MASIQITTVDEVITHKRPDRIVLDMSIEEALTLFCAVSHLSGHNNHTNNLYTELISVFEGIDIYDLATGGLHFEKVSMQSINAEAHKFRKNSI